VESVKAASDIVRDVTLYEMSAISTFFSVRSGFRDG
jgi:hypothetical protein